MSELPKVGVYICHCGINISGVVNVEEVKDYAAGLENVVFAKNYVYMCSDAGQNMIIKDIRASGINRVVVASCSPRMHESTFQKAISKGGLNPYLLEMANLREHCSWVHSDTSEEATEKAKALIKAAVAKASLVKPLTVERLPVKPSTLVIGGGIAGIYASLNIANAGFKVHLVEKRPSIGGNMARLDKTFPTLDCSQCILTPLMVEAARHPNIQLYTYSEVKSLDGVIGSFKAKIEKKPRYVDEGKCTGCGICASKCPVKVPSEFELGLESRGAIYFEFPQAVPMWPVIDSANCLYLNKGICRICERLCPAKAINLGQRPQQIEVDVGAIIVATGYSQYDVSSKMPEYGCGESESVITGLEFERLSSASGPTSGELKLSGRVPKSVAIILCVGSRDVNHLEYCCRIGCIAGLKHAYYVVSHIPDARVYVCYTDIRAFGKGYEEFYEKIRGRENVFFIRGRPSEIFIRQDGSPYFDVYDSNTNQLLTISPDLVVLETGLVPDPTISELRRVLNFSLGSDGFALELHPKLRPTETSVDGIFLAGAVQGPKDIPDTVAQAGAAAASAITLMARGYVESVPYTAEVDESLCSGCGICELLCAYGAISITEKEGRKAVVDALKCKGCGSCAAGCPSGALEQRGFERQQILAMVDAVSLP